LQNEAKAYLVDRIYELVALHGEMSTVPNRAATERLAAVPEDEPCLALATGRYVVRGSTCRAWTVFCSRCRSLEGGTVVQ